jgi:hypothetical protein
MKITTIRYYGGARDKVCRLALADLFLEVQQIIFDTRVEVLEESEANSAGVIRERLDEQFTKAKDWAKKVSGDIDWIKRFRYNQTLAVKMGVEIQVSARSDLLVRDLVHLRNSLQEGTIDIGIIVVPSDRLQTFLTDRTPSLKDAVRYVEKEFKEATGFPIVLIAVEHDAASKTPLPKKKTNRAEPGAKPA